MDDVKYQKHLDKVGDREVQAWMYKKGKYVRDWEALKQWQKVRKSRILTKHKIYKTSKGDVNLATPDKDFNIMLAEMLLPESENDSVLKWRRLYRATQMKANNLKMKAFGVYGNRETGTNIHKLIDHRRDEVIDLFGRMFTVKEVHQILHRDYGMRLAYNTVLAFKKRFQDEIGAKVVEFQQKYSDIRLAIKRGRIEELSWLYGKTKDRHEKSTGVAQGNLLLKILEQLRKETEGDKIKIEGDMFYQTLRSKLIKYGIIFI